MTEKRAPTRVDLDRATTDGSSDLVNPFVGIKAAVTRIAHDGTDTGQD
ncbi:hypothetical protein [Salipaludibacillus sp. CF4.18]